MVDLAAHERLGAVDDPPAARDRAVHVVARVVPEREAYVAALTVVATERVLVEGGVAGRGLEQERDLVRLEQAALDQEALLAVLGQLVGGQRHGREVSAARARKLRGGY